MQKIEIPSDMITNVDALNLESAVRSGWRLVYSFATKVPLPIQRTATLSPEMAQRVSNFSPTFTYSDYEMVETQMFVMVKDNADHVVQQAERIVELDAKATDARMAVRQMEEKMRVIEKELASSKQQIVDLSGDVTHARIERDNSRASQRKLEVDLGKVRESIGKKAMSEILGDGK
jgi:uncharacterized coiled-coil protein SlyX